MRLWFSFAASAIACLVSATSTRALTADELLGVWGEKRVFGPYVSGVLDIQFDGTVGYATIGAHRAEVRRNGEEITFELADELGGFRGRLDGTQLTGHWIQPRTIANGTIFASPVTFTRLSDSDWQGTVQPLEDAMTLYLVVQRDSVGSLSAFLRNPQRNAGRFTNIKRIEIDSNEVTFLSAKGNVLAEGTYSPDEQCLSVYLPWAGGTFDFTKATAGLLGGYFPVRDTTMIYTYTPPPVLDDGWPVASLREVGISSDSLSEFVQFLSDLPMESIHSLDLHAVLIARHGRLVLEEYFHGYHRNEPHDTRSASKTVTSTLVGAAKSHGSPLDESTPVYATMLGPEFAHSLDPRKQALTARHLLTMSSGLDCDDSDQESPGNEDVMQEQQAEPDWVKYTIELDMIRDPGEKAVYCSCNPNLLGGVLTKTTGTWIPEMFHDLLAEPMQFGHYAINLMPNGEGYMGGGARLLPRDFLKLGQMMLDGGIWNGNLVVSSDWAGRATSQQVTLEGHGYGYYWWIEQYPSGLDTLTAFFAGGNGGQIVMAIPKLDMVIEFLAGNYSDAVFLTLQRDYVPKYIIPAVIK